MAERFKVKDENEVWGSLFFLRSDPKPLKEKVGTGRDAREKTVGYQNYLISDKQDDVCVITPAPLKQLKYEYMTPIQLVKSEICPVGRSTRTSVYIEWTAYAENIVEKK